MELLDPELNPEISIDLERKLTSLKHKKRLPFKKGDKAKYSVEMNSQSWFNENIVFTILEDEEEKKYAGVWIDHPPEYPKGEDSIMYMVDGELRKAIVLYNFDISKNQLEIEDRETKKTLIINREDVAGYYVKDYILDSI